MASIKGGAEDSQHEVEAGKSWGPSAFLVKDNSLGIGPIDPRFMNTDASKALLALIIAKQIEMDEATHIGIVLEAWTLFLKDLPDQERTEALAECCETGVRDHSKKVDSLLIMVISATEIQVQVAPILGRPGKPHLGEWIDLGNRSLGMGFGESFVGPIQTALMMSVAMKG